MKCYKLTNQYQETINNTKWKRNVWRSIKDVDASQELCSEYWLHAYQSPLIAALMNPIHANIYNPRLFTAKAEGKFKYDGQCKFGCTRLRITKEIELPKITIEQRIKIAIYCALEVYKDESFIKWANDWLNGRDRSTESAKKARQMTYGSASNSAYYASYASYAANSYTYDDSFAAFAACDASYAIESAVNTNPKLDVIKIIKKVLKEKV